MESTERLVRTWVATGKDEEVAQVVSDIVSDRIALLDVVKALGEYLTSEDDILRTKGVEFLSLVLAQSPETKLNRQSVRVLTSFYCGKLEDPETIVPALKGLVTLTTLPSCTSVEATNIVEALFVHVKMRALVQSFRYLVFSIIQNILERHIEAIKAMNDAFLSGYLALAEGEKDPRNLLRAFSIARIILTQFDVTRFTESFFNITFCYFPITFKPPPNDPYGISTEDLRLALRGCLTALPTFALLAFPLFLEKLAAGSPATKQDTLQTMALCIPAYGAAPARKSARTLWNSLKLEIFQPTDPKTEAEALITVQALVNTIYSGESAESDEISEVEGLATDACDECLTKLQEPEKSQAKPAIKILCAFMKTTRSVSRYTLSRAVPHLVRLFLNPGEHANQPAILLLLSELILAAQDSAPKGDTGETPLSPYKDEILGVVSAGLKSSASRNPALAAAEGLVTTSGLLTDEELGFLVHHADEILEADEGESDDVRNAVLRLLSSIAAFAPRHIEEQTLPLLFSSLPDVPPPRNEATARTNSWRVLAALGTLCTQAELFETLIIRLTTKLDLVCVPATPAEEDDEAFETRAAYAHSILKTIMRTTSMKVDRGDPDIPKYMNRLVSRLYNLFIYAALIAEERKLVPTDPRLISVAADIITLVIRTLPLQRQQSLAFAVSKAFTSSDFEGIAEGQHKLPKDLRLLPFNDYATPEKRSLLALFAAGIVPLLKEVISPAARLDAFFDLLLAWGLEQADSDLQRGSAWHIISAELNKHAADVPAFLTNKLDQFWPRRIGDAKLPVVARRYALEAWVWISKALIIRGHPIAIHFTDRLFEAFGDEQIGWDVARAVGELISPDEVLTRKNHAVVRILYAQKFVTGILPRIEAGAKDASKPREQTAYLVALASIIKFSPRAAYTHQFPSLFPLLLRGLELPDPKIRANVIETFLTAASENHEGSSPTTNVNGKENNAAVSEHASTLVNAMLKNAKFGEMPSVQVRVLALKYLALLPSLVRYDVLHPYKPTVIKELGLVLDDPKRRVRKEAVDARSNWFKYNG